MLGLYIKFVLPRYRTRHCLAYLLLCAMIASLTVTSSRSASTSPSALITPSPRLRLCLCLRLRLRLRLRLYHALASATHGHILYYCMATAPVSEAVTVTLTMFNRGCYHT